MSTLTKLTPLLALGLLGGSLAAQDQAELQSRYEKKLHKEFVAFGGWITDYDVAREKAQQEGKLIFAYFSRSYAP